ncbi:MAG: sulfotransferase [Pseudomonadales bacterium]|nr:sulfotransferase [Pseudomonadales bacterium]
MSETTRDRKQDELDVIQKRIVDGDAAGALQALKAILATSPDHIEALYMVAVCHRYLGNAGSALEALERIKSLSPGHGRAHQEEGHIYLMQGRLDDALSAYARATQYNPALEASFQNRLEILVKQNRRQEALSVKAQLDRLHQLPKPLVAVVDLISQGKLVKAEDLCREFLKRVPHEVEAMRLLADIGIRLGVLDDAEFLLESATELYPDHIEARMDYVQVLRKRQKFERALAEAKRLLVMAPDHPQFQSIYAIECMQTGDFETAIETFDHVLERVPGDPVTLTSRGHALKTCGRTDEAIDSYRQALISNPQHGEAYYSLANLKTYRFSDEEMADMLAQERNTNLSHMDRVHLCFALGKANEDRGDYDESFGYYARGNGLKKAMSRYDAEKMSAEMAAQHAVCDSELFEAKSGAGYEAPDPIFIVGLPRAGSTLLEQILSSHSMVDGTLELPNVLSLSHRLRRGDKITADSKYPAALKTLSDDELSAFGKQYIEDTRIHRQGAPFFIDKMPNNFRHIGLIKLMLPNAKIIDARRAPMSCCFSGFKQLFADGQEFSYDLTDIGRYYRDYVSLMDHWDTVLPGHVLRVQYEDVVDDLETQVRRMLDYLGLPFEDACLRYWETERSIRTPSSEQVRRPVFREGVAQWRNFEPYLEPLKEALGDVLARYPIGVDA